ncbi:MAG: serine/threonine-protein phosphatase [Pyrinomonadaceae bacterium]|nr:serine/threonine-protein phosphatase [Pyrinomonadaceae bacterium]
MSEQSTDVKIDVAAITDRGLSKKRPLNEDSLLVDSAQHIFAVADGVGGAESGEVASQTAVEVLGEAFRHHQAGDDIEDLMEIAIQRANNSIHQMAREHPKLSMMATTIVALHLDGRRATIGHVGDSRLYRLSPDGRIHRETQDHSIVEEEMRAGRLTPEQAAHHPSRNVISRALGAEAAVEVDMKTIDVDDGTTFLLCSDGITRHITDDELRAVITGKSDLRDACEELKTRCFERGAEDNLTAVVVRVGDDRARFGHAAPVDDADTVNATDGWDEERTLIPGRVDSATVDPAIVDTLSGDIPRPKPLFERPFNDAAVRTAPPVAAGSAAPPARSASSIVDSEIHHLDAEPHAVSTHAPPHAQQVVPLVPRRSTPNRLLRVFEFLLFLIAASAAAFYGGMLYQQWTTDERSVAMPAPTETMMPFPSPEESSEARFDRLRREVDRAPATEASRMSTHLNNQPLSSPDPEFLYLYGRALLLSGKPQDAARALETAIARATDGTANGLTPERGQLKVESQLAAAAAHLRANDMVRARAAAEALDDATRADMVAPGSGLSPTPELSPSPLNQTPQQ